MQRLVRSALPKDLDDVCALLAAQFDEHAIDLGAERLRAAVAGLMTGPPRGRVLISRGDADVALGLACLPYTWTLEHGGLSAWLDELYVVPEARGRGVGAALLRAGIELARGDGCSAVDLEVDEAQARASRLYAREGFSRLARTRWQRNLANASRVQG